MFIHIFILHYVYLPHSTYHIVCGKYYFQLCHSYSALRHGLLPGHCTVPGLGISYLSGCDSFQMILSDCCGKTRQFHTHVGSQSPSLHNLHWWSFTWKHWRICCMCIYCKLALCGIKCTLFTESLYMLLPFTV